MGDFERGARDFDPVRVEPRERHPRDRILDFAHPVVSYDEPDGQLEPVVGQPAEHARCRVVQVEEVALLERTSHRVAAVISLTLISRTPNTSIQRWLVVRATPAPGAWVSFLQRSTFVDRTAVPAGLTWLVGIIAAVCVIWLLRAAALVVVPLVTAFFITISIYPVQVFLQRRLGPLDWAALPLTLLVLVAIIGGGVWALAESIDEAVERAPQHRERAAAIWQQARAAAREAGIPIPENLLQTADVQQRLARFGTAAVQWAWATISGLVLVFFLVVLMLVEGTSWENTAQRLLRDADGRTLAKMVSELAAKIRSYLYVRTILGLMSGGAAAVWLTALDVDLVLVWVVLTVLLNYIPNLGSVIAVLPPSLMALLQHGPTHGLVVLGGLTVIEQIIGNYIDPRIQGRRLHISPVVVLASLVFWTWVWGPIGSLLSVPVTVTLLAAAARSERLRPLAALASAESPDRGGEHRDHAA